MNKILWVASIAAFGFVGSAAGADIVRCVAPDGSVTYQQTACPESSRQQVAGIASEYPPVNLDERERVLAAEQQMYKRLEAQRDRDTRLVMAREARAAGDARAREAQAAAAAAEPQYMLALPVRIVRPHHPRVPRPTSQPVWTGGNPLSPGFSR